ncbi:MAG: ABC transporter ATP-binding protein [Candidatus Heimdallarchaeota archaeon]|nr:ABC transporter ATP-binding protein [Candidatus Heimdallarchaeota archaeon]
MTKLQPIVEIKSLNKTYQVKSGDVMALDQIDLEINPGEFVGLIGPSGSGKTTLINTIAGLITQTEGEVVINGIDMSNLSDAEVREFRLNNIGMIFQEHLLVDSLTALDNVEIPLIFNGENYKTRRKKARKLLKRVGLKKKEKHLPSDLSGGEQQRIGICRALMTNPKILLADEPTGDLDTRTGNEIIKLFKQIVEEDGISIIMVSHDPRHQKHFDRMIKLRDGKLDVDSIHD